MGELRLTMGTATAYPGGVVILGGDGSVEDGSDATFVRYSTTDASPHGPKSLNYYWHPAPVAIPNASATATRGIRARVRAQLLTAFDPAETRNLAVLNATTFVNWFTYHYVPSATVGWTDLGDFALTEAQWTTLQAGGASVEPTSAGTPFAENLCEVELTAWWTSKGIPPQRRYPDGISTGPTRHWPPPKSRRGYGGFH